ncbi:MAG: ABC transporter permease subunit [Bryobacterales bacterium]|jgi:putative spermidine/putrescine transport system permease protein|nr:ABC transporter permease subunit [Bryobacterales bacterium]
MRKPAGPVDAISRVSAFILIAGLALLPLATLAVQSVGRLWLWPALLPAAWSARAWEEALRPSSGVLTALGNSLGIALLVTVASVALALPAARSLAFTPFRGKAAFFFLLFLPILAPPLASAMGLHLVFLRLGLAGSWLGVALVHLIPAIPYATLLLTGSFSRLETDLEAQARTLGADRWNLLWRVTLPLLAPGIAVAASFAFLISWSQYILTLLIGSGQVLTLPLALVAAQRSGDQALAAAVCLLFLAPTGLLFLLVGRWLRDA